MLNESVNLFGKQLHTEAETVLGIHPHFKKEASIGRREFRATTDELTKFQRLAWTS